MVRRYKMLRYEQIIKDYLENDNIKLLGIQDGRILVEQEDNQKIFRVELVGNNNVKDIVIKNVHDEIEYKIELK
jgi:hypothetical protein